MFPAAVLLLAAIVALAILIAGACPLVAAAAVACGLKAGGAGEVRPQRAADPRALARFFAANAANAFEPGELPPAPAALFYNVHCFVSLDSSSTRRRVAGLLGLCAAEVVALAEVGASDAELREVLGAYAHYAAADNGTRDHTSRIVVAARRPLRDVEIVDTTAVAALLPSWVTRNQIVFRTADGYLGAVVHLEIGRRLAADGNDDSRRKSNSAIRIGQLGVLLERPLDFLFGDFNFTLRDPERAYLEDRGYTPANDDKEDSTPYNRVDHFFVRRGLPVGSNRLLRYNYSDHLPMVQALPRPT